MKTDATLVSTPEGVNVIRNSRVSRHFYCRMTTASRHRLWRLMDYLPQRIGFPVYYYRASRFQD